QTGQHSQAARGPHALTLRFEPARACHGKFYPRGLRHRLRLTLATPAHDAPGPGPTERGGALPAASPRARCLRFPEGARPRHGREPDFSNARYWFRRVGHHPIFEPLARAAAELASTQDVPPPARFVVVTTTWQPFAFIDLCEASLASSATCELLCRQIQQREW